MPSLLIITAVALAAGPPKLSDSDPGQRTAAVEDWAKKNAPVALPERKNIWDRPCKQVPAPREVRCSKRVWLCVDTDSFSLGGTALVESQTRFARLFATKQRPTPYALDHDERRFDLFAESKTPLLSHFHAVRYPGHCGHRTPDSYFPREFSEEVRQHLRTKRQEAANAAFERCREQSEARSKESDLEVKCEILLINPCRQELFARCSGKNIEKLSKQEPERVPVADRVFRLTWAREEDAQN